MLPAIFFVVSRTHYMAVVVDVLDAYEFPARVGRDKAIEIPHYSVAVKEGMLKISIGRTRLSDYLAFFVEGRGIAVAVVRLRESAQVLHRPAAVEEGVSLSVAARM